MAKGEIHPETGTICKAVLRACKYGDELHIKSDEDFINYHAARGLSRSFLRETIDDGNSLSEALEIAKEFSSALPKTEKKEIRGDLEISHTGSDGGLHYWLKVDGENVAYAKVYLRNGVPNLCDIETREDKRNQGYASALLAKIAKENNVEQVSHNGGYTPDGLDYISKKVKRDYEPLVESPVVRPDYKPMDFVADWNDRYIHGS